MPETFPKPPAALLLGVQMSEWKPISSAPKDGRQITCKRVYQGQVIFEGRAVWSTLHPSSPALLPMERDQLRRVSDAEYAAERAGIGKMKTEKAWLTPDCRFFVPGPTHWLPGPDTMEGVMDDRPFADKLASLTASEAAKAKGDPERMGAMVERLSAALGFTIAIAANGDGPTIDEMMSGAEAYAHQEAVDKAPLIRLMSEFRRLKPTP